MDVKVRLSGMIEGLSSVGRTHGIPVVFPMHPRTQKMMKEFGIDASGITSTEPIGYMEFLELEANARLILTDSGGVQEEACIFRVPCVTLRENTERPETIDVGANVLAGTDARRIIEAGDRMLSVANDWQNPYGDGNVGERIVGICTTKKRSDDSVLST